MEIESVLKSQIKIIVTDANYKHTLGIVRSLGRAGYYIVALGQNKRSQSFYSKYCKEKLISPDPKNEVEFVQFLENYLMNNKIDILLPVGYNSTITISNHRDKLLPLVTIPLAGKTAIEIASDKRKTLDLAKKLNILTPMEYYSVKGINKYPVVVKGIYESGQIRYINSQEEVNRIDFSTNVVQEYIPGDGYGLYALFNKGELRTFFMHQRIREYPITGGSSTCAKSVFYEELKNTGIRILKELKWHGVAMVEFKKDTRNDNYVLMEINPKFWGSLDLSISSNLDFPRLLVEMSLKGDIEPIDNYSKDIIFRWPFPDDFLFLFSKPSSIIPMIRELFNKKAFSNIMIEDFFPNIIQIINTIIVLKSKILNKNLRYPHGKPKI
ncbi:ATP-grasp domain-containing protein [Methanospirillum purgamenti]|uniref:ATP-grasp domain-containing protein n=1 Tax=Methanospirillum hungatei TaxID=2203 RepID=A0A8F5ZEN3_METHU|nr:ATP-grasp domain-containing protein [Methanospirillum hungatei]QXO93564.1 ATP-grasp domain-containing protein [Methanospirillum hungatei]